MLKRAIGRESVPATQARAGIWYKLRLEKGWWGANHEVQGLASRPPLLSGFQQRQASRLPELWCQRLGWSCCLWYRTWPADFD